MRLLTICALGLTMGIGASSPVVAQQTASSTATEAKPTAVLGWLVGGVWTADASKLGPGMERIETRYQWSDNGSYVRFTTHFVTDKGSMKMYDGNLFWDPGKKTLAMWYMDARNAITEGPMSFVGSDWNMTFRGEDFDGKQADFRVEVTRKTDDLYHWSLNEKVGDGWKKLMELDYVRKAEG